MSVFRLIAVEDTFDCI